MNMMLVSVANRVMSLGAGNMLSGSNVQDQKWFTELIKAIQSWVTPLLVLAAAAGSIWAIVLGIKMAQADDKSKRDEAKANLINVIIALVAVIALILIFTIVGDAILDSNGIGQGSISK